MNDARGPSHRINPVPTRRWPRTLLTERDQWLLGLIGEQYALTMVQLERLTRGVLYLRDRWTRAGLVEGGRLTYTLPWMMWLTPYGATTVGSPYRAWRPKPGQAAHLAAITDVRLLLEHELRRGQWHCERELAQSAGRRSRGFHVPDGLLDTGSERIAIEVELTVKGQARLAAIVQELAIAHDRVWYFASDPVARSLREVLRTSPWESVTVYPYPAGPADLLE